jgi:predicted ester cyclase
MPAAWSATPLPSVAKGYPVCRQLPVGLLVCVLACVTGLTLLGVASLVTEGPRWSVPAGSDTDAKLVRGFYDAVNVTLRSGDSAGVLSLLATDFVGYGGPPGYRPTRDGFVRYLLALHTTFPDMQLRAESVHAADGVVVARVRVDGAEVGTFLGLSLIGLPAVWGAVDVFRIDAVAIAEHWGGGANAPFLDPLHEVPLDPGRSALQVVTLNRTAVAPGASVAIGDVLGQEALFLERGRLTVAVAVNEEGEALLWRNSIANGVDPREAVAPESQAEMGRGELFMLPPGSTATVHNDSDRVAVFLTIAVRAPGGPRSVGGPSGTAPENIPPAGTPGVTTSALAGQPLLALPDGPAHLGLGRVVLAPGASLPVVAPGAALFVVEAGGLELVSTAGTVWSWDGADSSLSTVTSGTIGQVDTLTFEPGASGEVRSVADALLMLLVVTITPAIGAN